MPNPFGYVRVRSGQLKEFTGISAPYEPPERPDLEFRTGQLTVPECVGLLLDKLRQTVTYLDKYINDS